MHPSWSPTSRRQRLRVKDAPLCKAILVASVNGTDDVLVQDVVFGTNFNFLRVCKDGELLVFFESLCHSLRVVGGDVAEEHIEVHKIISEKPGDAHHGRSMRFVKSEYVASLGLVKLTKKLKSPEELGEVMNFFYRIGLRWLSGMNSTARIVAREFTQDNETFTLTDSIEVEIYNDTPPFGSHIEKRKQKLSYDRKTGIVTDTSRTNRDALATAASKVPGVVIDAGSARLTTTTDASIGNSRCAGKGTAKAQ